MFRSNIGELWNSNVSLAASLRVLLRTALILCLILPYGPSNDGGSVLTSMVKLNGKSYSPGSRGGSVGSRSKLNQFIYKPEWYGSIRHNRRLNYTSEPQRSFQNQ